MGAELTYTLVLHVPPRSQLPHEWLMRIRALCLLPEEAARAHHTHDTVRIPTRTLEDLIGRLLAEGFSLERGDASLEVS